MSIAEAPLNPVPAVTDPCAITEHAIRLRNVPWEAYAALREPELNNHVRMTYDCGDLEIMSPSGKHAKVSSLIGFMIYEWAMLREIAMDFGGDMTLKRVDLSRGLEADECYWIANTELIRGKDEIDLSVDPPPDLALEVEVSHNLVPKLPIYQALGVPEVWHWRDNSLVVLTLDSERKYTQRSDSIALPGFPFQLAEQFVRQRHGESGTALMLRIREAMAKLPRE